jgi:hypothetical protein
MPQNFSVSTVDLLALNFSPGLLRHKRSGNRIPAGAIDLLLSEHVKTGSGAHPASYTIDTGPVSLG